jgi:hypothetical protein
MLSTRFHAFLMRRSRRKSAARSRGLVTDLHLTDQQYATLLSILYVRYSNPSLYFPFSVAAYDLISFLIGITT